MKDPSPENITGSKQVQHIVEHRINWGHVALGLAAIFIAYQGKKILDESSRDDRRERVDGAAIEIEGAGTPGTFLSGDRGGGV